MARKRKQKKAKAKAKRKQRKPKRGPQPGRMYETDPPVVTVETAPPSEPDPPSVVTECPVCKSARRTAYYSRRRANYDGNVILWRRCRCLNCGQIRVDRVSYRQGGEPPAEEGEREV